MSVAIFVDELLATAARQFCISLLGMMFIVDSLAAYEGRKLLMMLAAGVMVLPRSLLQATDAKEAAIIYLQQEIRLMSVAIFVDEIAKLPQPARQFYLTRISLLAATVVHRS